MFDPYPLFVARGTPRELGRQHGEQAAERVRRYLDVLSAGLGLSRLELRSRAARFRPLFERTCPRLLEEVEGLAQGAAIDPLDALAVQLRGELGPLPDGGCTTFVIGPRGTARGEVLIGQTSDNPAELIDCGYVIRLEPEAGPRMLMWSFGGMLGYHGLNERGVAHFANSLGGGPGWRFALSHYPLKRMILECASLPDVLRLMRDVPVCSNGNYVLCDGEGRIADVELTSEGPHEICDGGEGFIAHSNHYLCPAHACEANFRQGLPDSFPRLDRMRELIRAKFGAITPEDAMSFLRDHAGHPTGICRHPHEGRNEPMLPASGRTVAALVAEPSRGVLHVSTGNACENPFVVHHLETGGEFANPL